MAALAYLEEASRCCILECDGPGHLDERVLACSGLAVVVVRSGAAGVVARRLGTPHAVTGFESAARLSGLRSGVVVAGDRSARYTAAFLSEAPELVVFEGIESLWLPSCPDLRGRTVWMTRFCDLRLQHRGYATDCFSEALACDAVCRRRGPSGRPRPVRDLYHDVRGDEAELVLGALEGGDEELAVKAFPGYFERLRGERGPPGECPICYEAPRVRVTSMCCGRDFCLECACRCAAAGPSCPWCRAGSGLWNYSMEPGRGPAPFQDVLLLDLATGSDRVVVVTSDDGYTLRGRCNPLPQSRTCWVGGTSQAVAAAMESFESGDKTVAVVDADRLLGAGLVFPSATRLVFTDAESCSGHRYAYWAAACPNAADVRCMVAVTAAAQHGRMEKSIM